MSAKNTAEGGRQWARAWDAFASGVTRPSWQAAVIAVATILGFSGVCVTAITPPSMAEHLAPYLAKDSHDYDTHATQRLLKLTTGASTEPIVVVTGASAIWAGVLEDELARVLRLEMETDVRVYKFATGAQSLWDSAALLDRLPKRAHGVAVLGVGPHRLALEQSALRELSTNPRLGFRSEAFDEEVRLAGLEPSPRTGNYFIDNRSFLLPRMPFLIQHLITGAVPIKHRYMGQEQADEALWKKSGDWGLKLSARYDANHEVNASIISRMAERLVRDTEMSLVLLAPPVSPRFLRDYASDLYQRANGRAQRLAEEHDVEYWDLEQEVRLVDDDFFDSVHLRNQAAIHRYTRALGKRVANVLTGRRGRMDEIQQ